MPPKNGMNFFLIPQGQHVIKFPAYLMLHFLWSPRHKPYCSKMSLVTQDSLTPRRNPRKSTNFVVHSPSKPPALCHETSKRPKGSTQKQRRKDVNSLTDAEVWDMSDQDIIGNSTFFSSYSLCSNTSQLLLRNRGQPRHTSTSSFHWNVTL